MLKQSWFGAIAMVEPTMERDSLYIHPLRSSIQNTYFFKQAVNIDVNEIEQNGTLCK